VKLSHFEGSSDYIVHSHSGGGGGGSGGYLADNGLRSIAKGSADQALSAVASQNAAGKQASYVAAAGQAAKQAADQLNTITLAVKNAQDNVVNSEHVASGAQQELGEKQQLVEAAKKRVELLLRQLEVARVDFKNTKNAAEKAACAAQEARHRATRERRRAELRHLLWLKRGRTN